MPPIRSRDYIMPLGAFCMAIVLLTFARHTIGQSRKLAHDERDMLRAQVLQERRRLGMDDVQRSPGQNKEAG